MTKQEKTGIGPYPIVWPPRPEMKLEARCHRCRWSWFGRNEDELRLRIEEHLEDLHRDETHPLDRFGFRAMT